MPQKVWPISFDEDVAQLLEPYRKNRQASRVVNEAVWEHLKKGNLGQPLDEDAVRKIVAEYIKEHGVVLAPSASFAEETNNNEMPQEKAQTKENMDSLDEFLDGLK